MPFDAYLVARTPMLLRFATAVTGDPHLAEDVVQDVLVRASGRWDRIGRLEHPDAYVRRMVVNEFLSWRRKWARMIPSADVRPTTDAPDHADRLSQHDELVTALRTLPTKQRVAVTLRYYADQTDDQIAEALHCSTSTVRSQISRALAKLRVEVEPRMSVLSTEGADDADHR